MVLMLKEQMNFHNYNLIATCMPGPTGKFAGSSYVELTKEELLIPNVWITKISTFLLAVYVNVPVYIESSALGGNIIAIRLQWSFTWLPQYPSSLSNWFTS
jgi:hypothetical protein